MSRRHLSSVWRAKVLRILTCACGLYYSCCGDILRLKPPTLRPKRRLFNHLQKNETSRNAGNMFPPFFYLWHFKKFIYLENSRVCAHTAQGCHRPDNVTALLAGPKSSIRRIKARNFKSLWEEEEEEEEKKENKVMTAKRESASTRGCWLGSPGHPSTSPRTVQQTRSKPQNTQGRAAMWVTAWTINTCNWF